MVKYLNNKDKLVYNNHNRYSCCCFFKINWYPDRINNVSDANNLLLHLCANPQYQQECTDTKVEKIHIDIIKY